MADMKTRQNDNDVSAFLNGLPDDQKRQDSYTILNLMKEVSGFEPRMWGESIIGFGQHHYIYESGREGDWFCIGIAPRKAAITVYLTYGLEQALKKFPALGKYKTGVACLYVRRLSDIDLSVLRPLMKWSLDRIHGCETPTRTGEVL